MDIYLRFGMHRDVPTIHKGSHLIDGLVVPAHILAYQAAATGVFVSSLPDHHYLIDPMTYMLQNPRSSLVGASGGLKASISALCEQVDPELLDLLEDDGDYIAATEINSERLTEGTLAFQERAVEEGRGHSRARKYLDRYARTAVTAPRAIIPPYFFFDAVGDAWYETSLRCASLCLEAAAGAVLPVICCQVAALRGEALDQLVADYDRFEGCILWFEGYGERSVAAREIRGAREVVRRLSGDGARSVEVLYGGYLCVLFGEDGVRGVSHGILFTQSRPYTRPPGAGGVPKRYYIPAIHQFRSLSQADLILHQHPELICDCEVCKEHIGGDPDNIIRYADDPELLRLHFLTVRRREADGADGMELEEEAERLRGTYERYHASFRALRNPDAVLSGRRMRGLGYLREWADAFAG